MAFSVAPTLGILRVISRPSRRWAVQRRQPPSSRMPAPSCRRTARCRSMGRGPSSHPPGWLISAQPIRARMDPRNTTEERISRIRWSGMSHRSMPLASTTRSPPSQSARQPRWRRMRMLASTSLRWGQPWSTVRPGCRMDAARMGRTLFFAPWTGSVPSRRAPPCRMIWLINGSLRP